MPKGKVIQSFGKAFVCEREDAIYLSRILQKWYFLAFWVPDSLFCSFPLDLVKLPPLLFSLSHGSSCSGDAAFLLAVASGICGSGHITS